MIDTRKACRAKINEIAFTIEAAKRTSDKEQAGMKLVDPIQQCFEWLKANPNRELTKDLREVSYMLLSGCFNMSNDDIRSLNEKVAKEVAGD